MGPNFLYGKQSSAASSFDTRGAMGIKSKSVEDTSNDGSPRIPNYPTAVSLLEIIRLAISISTSEFLLRLTVLFRLQYK
jgi:hypothetical protein